MALWKVYMCVVVFGVIDISAIKVTLSKVGKTVRGSNITFTATVTGYTPGETLKFDFRDNATPHHETTIVAATDVANWTVSYPKSYYEAGDYKVTVNLMKDYILPWTLSTDSTTFQLTETLNGNLLLIQNETSRPNSYVAVNQTVQHKVALAQSELDYLLSNSSSVLTYWFKDCQLMGSTDDFTYNFTYTDSMSDHHIEAIVIAYNQPLPPITTTTTTTTTTPPPTTKTTKEIPKTTVQSTTSLNKSVQIETFPVLQLSNETKVLQLSNETIVLQLSNETKVLKLSNETKVRSKRSADDFACKNTIPIGDYYTYGRVETKLSVREPISTVNITGSSWLQHGDLLELEVKYTGSPPFDYCYLYKPGLYNVTGNETCEDKSRTISNNFPIVHYFSDSDQHTVVVVLQNDIGKTVSRATINIYKTAVHAQLSVIVIPVFFCLVAVILVVFGIAYYQHRSRHTIEVADFDFGQAHPNYKSFRERLRDSFRNAFDFGRDDTDPLTSNSRYDSMS